MNPNNLRSIVKNLTEQKAPAAQIDLWPAIQSRLQMGQSIQSKGTIMKPQFRILHLAYVFIAVALIGVVFLAFPQGRALAQQVLHFFSNNPSNIIPGPTSTPVKWVEQTPGVTIPTATPEPTQLALMHPVFEQDCGTYINPHCSIDAIRQKANFPVFALPDLPAGLQFTGATGGPQRVHLYYQAVDQTNFLQLVEEPYNGSAAQLAETVGADADIQSVQVGADSAEYVRGNYNGNYDPAVWDNSLNTQTMRWIHQNVMITLYMSDADTNLGRNALVTLAATLTDGPVGASGSPAATPAIPVNATDVPALDNYPLTLAQAEEKIGARLLSPAILPVTFSFKGAVYDEKTGVVELYYQYIAGDPDSTDALLIREQLAPTGKDCELCGFVQGDGTQLDQYPAGKLISKKAVIETIQIGDFSGQYVEGVGWVGSDCCGWQWDSTSYTKRLRVKTDKMAFEISAYTSMLQKADVIAIAQSMK